VWGIHERATPALFRLTSRQRRTPGVVVTKTGRTSAADSAARVRVKLLAGFELTIDEEAVALPQPCQRLLAFLAIHDRPLLRSYVAASLWLDTMDDRAHANLRSALWRLNSLGYRLVEANARRLQLARNVEVDLREAAMLAQRLTEGLATTDDLQAASGTLAADVLPDWYDEWLLVERERFRQLRLHVLESLCERLAAAGDLSGALRAGLAAVAGDPLRESAHRALIRVYLAEGNHGEAVRQYEIFRRLLHEQVGLEPSAHIEDLVFGLDERPDARAKAG
jgi:DNA-binding SARP family transcriptional activator